MKKKPARFPSAIPPSNPSAALSARRVAITNRHPRLRLDRRAVTRVIHLLDAHAAAILAPAGKLTARLAMPPGELSLVFLTDPALAQLHAEFLDDPTPTDVITFEGDSAPGLPPEAAHAGEICVSADTAAVYSREHGHDFSTELTLYVVHGWLHLAGHDDLVPAKKRAMRRAEARALAVLTRARAIPPFHLRPVKKPRPTRAIQPRRSAK